MRWTPIWPALAAVHRPRRSDSICTVDREGRVMRKRGNVRCPVIVVAMDGKVRRAGIFASVADDRAEIAIRVRQAGWQPYSVRFDDAQPAWIVSTLSDQQMPPSSSSAISGPDSGHCRGRHRGKLAHRGGLRLAAKKLVQAVRHQPVFFELLL